MAKKEREPLLYIACGKKGVGKTYTTKKVLDEYVKGNIVTGAKPRKVLILDVNNEYTDYRRISPIDIRKWTVNPYKEIRRITPHDSDGNILNINQLEEIFIDATKNFRNGLILAEDLTKFVGDSLPAEIVASLCTNRHTDVDIIAHFQSIGKAGHPKLKANMNILRLHKCLDTVEYHKNKFTEYTEILKIAEKLVNKRYDAFAKSNRNSGQTYFNFFVFVDFDHNQIKGDFSKKEFQEVITEYVQENENTTIIPILRIKDRSGRKLYDYGKALSKAESDIFEKYAPLRFVK
ncbi:MAG: DUF87 domain-containing protein [Atribacterota bacterium]|nr:DUF87 domain-containing protein [Atribacterota bacterium]